MWLYRGKNKEVLWHPSSQVLVNSIDTGSGLHTWRVCLAKQFWSRCVSAHHQPFIVSLSQFQSLQQADLTRCQN